MTHLESLEKGLADNKSHIEIIRKVYLTYPTMAMVGDEEREFTILNEISIFFNIPINNIQVAGSAKTGHSFHKNTKFTPQKSDLDIAIIDPNLFRYYSEAVFKLTKGLKNRTGFKPGNYSQYTDYIARGIFRPDLMPNGTIRAEWFSFFGQLSQKHNDLFETINCGLYMSQLYFEYKQISIIKDYLSSKTI
jgi:hypothetical protein